MLGREGSRLRLSDITARRVRRARVRRQEVVEIEGDVTSDDGSDGVESESDSEDEEEGTQLVQPGQPTPTSKSERVIPTLTAITHSPRPPPGQLTSTPVKKEDPATRTTLSISTTAKAGYTPPAVEAGAQVTPTSENYPSATTGAKGLLEYSGPGPTQIADSDDVRISVTDGKGGGLNAGAKAGIAVGVIAGVALLAAIIFFSRKWFLSYLSRKESQEPSPPRSPEALNNTNPGAAPSATIDPRSNSQVLDELIAASYAHQNGGSLPPNAATMPPAFMYDEKLRPSRNAEEADPQPQIRTSIASWLRRHHPLKLNPRSARGSLFSNASKSPSPGDTESTPNSQRNTMVTEKTSSVYDYYAGSSSDDLVPPLPPAYAGQSQSKSKAAQMAKYQSVWSESTATSGGQDRMVSGVPESVVTDASGNSSILWLYGRPVTNITTADSTGSVYLEPLPVSPVSPTEGDGRPFKRGSSPVLPPGY